MDSMKWRSGGGGSTCRRVGDDFGKGAPPVDVVDKVKV